MTAAQRFNRHQNSNMAVFTRAKELSRGVFKVTQDAPKKFRFSLVGRMQSTGLQLLSHLYRANEVFIDLKLLSDIDRSIAALEEGRRGEEAEKEGPLLKQHRDNKLLTLKLTRATKFQERISKRLDEQTAAMACLKELDHLLVLAREMQCITTKQHEQLALLQAETRKLLGGWIKGDRKRYGY